MNNFTSEYRVSAPNESSILKIIQFFESDLGTNPSNLVPYVPNFDRIDLNVFVEVGKVASESTRTLILCHADASSNGMKLLDCQKL